MAIGTKDKILETAHFLFEDKGFNGVTMREISAQSGINKGLLHYYFKSKQAIFLGVFKNVINLLYIDITEILEREDIDFDIKISSIVDSYFTLFSKHPKLPLFVLSELAKLSEFSESTGIENRLGNVALLIEENMKDFKKVEPGDGFQLLLSLASLCAFPFMASPIVELMRPQKFKTHVEFMESRKSYVKNILIKSYR